MTKFKEENLGLFGIPEGNNQEPEEEVIAETNPQVQETETESEAATELKPEVSQPSLTYSQEQLDQAVSSAIKSALEQQRVENENWQRQLLDRSLQPQSSQKEPEIDPDTYFKAGEDVNNPARLLYDRVQSLIDNKVNSKVKPVEDQLQQALGIINLLNARKADSPEAIEHHDAAIELMNKGLVGDYSTAIELIQLRTQKEKPKEESTPTRAPTTKPIPSKAATAPTASKADPRPKEKRRRGQPSVLEVIQEDSEILELLKQGKM